MIVHFPFKDLKFKSKLHFVRIFFDSSTFDRVTRVRISSPLHIYTSPFITQDEKAKSIDKLSAVGGTMGLLTGFSLISAVEIIFFVIKIVASLVQQKLDWKIKM